MCFPDVGFCQLVPGWGAGGQGEAPPRGQPCQQRTPAEEAILVTPTLSPGLTSTFPEQSGNLGSLGASHWSRWLSDTTGREGHLAEDPGPGQSPGETAVSSGPAWGGTGRAETGIASSPSTALKGHSPRDPQVGLPLSVSTPTLLRGSDPVKSWLEWLWTSYPPKSTPLFSGEQRLGL